MTVIVEGALRFEFGASWKHVVKYDQQPVYRDGIEGLKGKARCDLCQGNLICPRCKHEPTIDSRAVDIVGNREGQVYFIEIKDFRRRETPKRPALAIEVARKVRDTVASLVGALHGRDSEALRPLIVPVFKRPPRIILWMEETLEPQRIERRGDPTLVMRGELLKRLHWLSQGVWVVNLESQAARLGSALDLKVRAIPMGLVELRDLMKQRAAISSEEFCRAMRVSPQVAGQRLARLCEQGVLLRAPGDRYAAGPGWEQYDEDRCA